MFKSLKLSFDKALSIVTVTIMATAVVALVTYGIYKVFSTYHYRDAYKVGQCLIGSDLEAFQKVTSPIMRIDEVGEKLYKVKINMPVTLLPGDPVDANTPRAWVGQAVMDKALVNRNAEVIECPSEY